MLKKNSQAKWEKSGSIFAFPHGWQYPAKTEQWVYEELLSKKIEYNHAEYVAFPWATLIDLLDRGEEERAKNYLKALNELPKKKAYQRVTACQHIKLNSVIELMKNIGITDIFWSHKKINEDLVGEIRLEPLALYPVAFYEVPDLMPKKLDKRDYLYTFLGAYDPGCYISDVRASIFKIKPRDNILIKQRKKWHFEDLVYKSQIHGDKLTDIVINENHEMMKEYCEVLANTIFSLCPSGAGPNSIRYWESLAFGCVPILISDFLETPSFGQQEIRIPEKDINNIDYILNDKKDYYVNNIVANNECTPNKFLANLFQFFKIKN